MNNGLFQQIPDMQTMYPQGPPMWDTSRMPNVPQGNMPLGDMSVMNPKTDEAAALPTLGGVPPQNPGPYYTGNAIVDKYIHSFIGAV